MIALTAWERCCGGLSSPVTLSQFEGKQRTTKPTAGNAWEHFAFVLEADEDICLVSSRLRAGTGSFSLCQVWCKYT